MPLHSTEGLRQGASGESSFQALSCELPTAGLQSPADFGNLTPQQRHETNASRNPGEDRSGISAAALLAVNLPAKRAEALGWVTRLPFSTARELEDVSGLRKIAQRLTELERQGLIEEAGLQVCRVTGRVATTWRPTGNAPRPLERRPTSRERIEALEALAEQLEAENAQLRARLAESCAPREQLDLPVWPEVRQ